MMMASLGRGSGEWIRLRRRWGTWRNRRRRRRGGRVQQTAS